MQMEGVQEEGFVFRCLDSSEVAEYLKPIHDLEIKAFPADEAATQESMLYRLSNAREYFYVLEKKQNGIPFVIGYVCSTLAEGPSLTHDSMYEHKPNANLLCIHSVAVDPERRRKGIATAMLKKYVEQVTALHGIEDIALICKKLLIGLYERSGFEYAGESEVVHGRDQWYEMRISNSNKS